MLLLSLAIGLNTSVFSFVDAALVRPLPYPDSDRLVFVSESHPDRGPMSALRPANFFDWKRESTSFVDATGMSPYEARFEGSSGPELVPVRMVLEDFFATLGVSPALGRTFTDADHAIVYKSSFGPGHGLGRVAVLSYAFWRRAFGGDPAALGGALILDGSPFTIVGVMPLSFQGIGGATAVYVPWGMNDATRAHRETHLFYCIARLRDGVSLETARAEMKSIYQRLEKDHPEQNAEWTVDLAPWRDVLLGESKPGLILLLGGSCLLLLIAGLNASWLIFARNRAREREIAIRRALGAGAGRLFRQFFAESLLLIVVASVLSMLLAWWSLRLLSGLQIPTVIPFTFETELNRRVLGFGLLACAIAAIAFGVIPLARESSRRRRGAFLVASQVAFVTVVLTFGLLLVRSFVELSRADVGFEPQALLSLRLTLPTDDDDHGEAPLELLDRLEREVSAIPSVQSAATSLYLPLQHIGMNLRFEIEGRSSRTSDQFNAPANVVSPEYFRTIGAALVSGRAFVPEDLPESPRVAVINETMAREYWRGEDPIGKRLTFPYPDLSEKVFTIVGIVADVTHDRSPEPARTVYLSRTQGGVSEFLIVRASTRATDIVDAIKARIRSVDETVIISEIRELDEIASQTLRAHRIRALLFAFYSAVSLFLAAIGLFGLLARSVSERAREIGIRMALGASRSSVLLLVSRSGLEWSATGLAVGLVTALGATRFLSSFLYGVSPYDPVAFLGTGLALMATAFLACLLPARRAADIDPATALRRE